MCGLSRRESSTKIVNYLSFEYAFKNFRIKIGCHLFKDITPLWIRVPAVNILVRKVELLSLCFVLACKT